MKFTGRVDVRSQFRTESLVGNFDFESLAHACSYLTIDSRLNFHAMDCIVRLLKKKEELKRTNERQSYPRRFSDENSPSN